jgi:hypothetical protein
MSALYDELTNDPEALGYAAMLAAGSHNAIAAALNMARYPALGSVDITPLLEWIAAHGIMARLRTAASGNDAALASIAEVALMLVSNPNIPALDLSRPRVQAMLGALYAGGVVTEAAYNELLSMAAVQVSRAAVLGLGTVTADDVSRTVVEG